LPPQHHLIGAVSSINLKNEIFIVKDPAIFSDIRKQIFIMLTLLIVKRLPA